MRKAFIIGGVVLISLLLLAVSCAKPAPTPTPAPTPAPAPAPEKVYQLKFTTHNAPGYFTWFCYEGFEKEVEEKSGGRIMIDLYPSESLVKSAQVGEAVRTGVADIGFCLDNYMPDMMPLSQMWCLPPLWKSSVEGAAMWGKLYDEFWRPERDRLNLHQIGQYILPSYVIFLKTKAATSLADIKGATLRSFNPISAEVWTLMGAVPVNVAYAETYDALQKGMVDGSGGTPSMIKSMKWYETGKPGYLMNVGGIPSSGNSFLMNKGLYDSMPKDLQNIIDEAGRTWHTKGWNETADKDWVTDLEFIRKAGAEYIDWDTAKKTQVREILAPMWDKWAKETDAKGLPGSKLVAAIKALAK